MGYEKETNVKRELASPTAQKMLQQFLKNKEGLGGDKKAYERGYIFSFELRDFERAIISKRMDEGTPFSEAFDAEYPAILESRRNGGRR